MQTEQEIEHKDKKCWLGKESDKALWEDKN